MAAYPQVSSPPPGLMGYSSMSPPPIAGYVPGFPQPGSRGYNPMANYAAPGVPSMVSRNPQHFASPPQHNPVPSGATPQKGTLRPGQEIRVGKQTVVIEKYLSEGGYAHVYLTHSSTPIGNNRLTTHCLKRIAFRDDQGTDMLKETEKEIQVMKALRGNDRIVEYLDSEMRRLESRRDGGPGWEVFILMEFCGGGGIIDLLNKRLRDRLREDEILTIFVDVCEAVAHMHTLPQPLLHRDLKIENILCSPISSSASSSSSSSISAFRYKVCDFGSTTYPASHAPRSKREAEALAYDLNRHTTLQYRSPEMVEPLLGLPVGLPADVWALGVLLYKLCYYTTPFEEHGPLAIVNAKYTFPPYPVYSPVMQHLIALMLVEQPARRPTVVDIYNQLHRLRGTQPSREYAFASSSDQAQSSKDDKSAAQRTGMSVATGNLLDFRAQDDVLGSARAPTTRQPDLVSTIQPQRRGRPTKAPVASSNTATSPSAGIQPIPSFRIQVTGGDASAPAKPPSSRSDLVGDIKKFAIDFGDAFSPADGLITPALEKGNQSSGGFDDGFDGSRFAPPTAAPLGKARTTSPPPPEARANSGFGDSFAPPRVSDIGRQNSSKTISLPIPADTKRSISPMLSPSSEHSSNFEDRFPSVEQLAARAESSPGNTLVKSPETMTKPLRPSFGRNSSSEVNSRGLSFHQPSITGGPAEENQKMRLLSIDERPQPRSTHVTGTAFTSGGQEAAPSRKQPSFDLLGSMSPTSDMPSPSLIQNPASRDARSPNMAQQSSGDAKPNLSTGTTRLDLDTGLKLEVTSPDTTEQPSRKKTLPRDLLTGGTNGSFDDYNYAAMLPSGNKTTGRGPPPVNVKPAKLGRSGGQDPHTGSPLSPTAAPSNTIADIQADAVKEAPKVSKPRPLPSKPDYLRQPGSPSRGQSARTPPSSYSPVSPGRVGRGVDVKEDEGSSTSMPTRPAAISRRSSINEMVAKYESLSSPKLENEGFDLSSPRPRGQTVPKPAPKPVQLRTSAQVDSSETGSGLNRSRSMFLPAEAPRRRLTPELAERPVRTPSVHRETTEASNVEGEPGGRKAVNALIAKWNQGTVPAQGTHPSAAKARAPLGSGRRL